MEAAFYLVKRRRLGHLALHNPRAELVNRYLDDPPTLLMPVHMGTYTAHVAMTVVHHLAASSTASQHWAMLVAFVAMVDLPAALPPQLPYALVRRNPERSLLLLLPLFHLYAQALAPLVRALRKRRRRRAAPSPRRDRRRRRPRRRCRRRPCTTRTRAAWSDAVARFSETQVRDVMTPRPDIVAMPARRQRRRTCGA